VIRGRVHDDNAWWLGGAAGHAGLFGRVEEIWRSFDPVRRAYQGRENALNLQPGTVRRFWDAPPGAPDSVRAWGYDRPEAKNSSAGDLLSQRSVGHLGFTGTSLWHDPDRDLTVILLTNRVHPSADNQAIKTFRPHIHDRVVRLLSL
jgi:CubicO group peptidase (beta-lactamase class C family)